MEKAHRSLAEAREDSTAQEVINRVDFQSHQLNIARRQLRFDRARSNYERTQVHAAKPGIVVYRKISKPGAQGESKVTIGDNIWGGHALIDLPDLSKMQVRCLVGEMDIKRIEIGQKASIRLEAFPGPIFRGVVSHIAPMATPQPDARDIRVFEMLVDISEEDNRLKPGMSAEVAVVIEHHKETLTVPLAAVVYREEKRYVYRVDGSSMRPVEVSLGSRNSRAVIVKTACEREIAFRSLPPNRPRVSRKERLTLSAKESPKKERGIQSSLLFLLVPLVAAYFWFALPDDRETSKLVSYPVEQGEFIISLNLKGGELEAVKAENIVAPRVRGELKITHLFPEGEQVDVGDLLVQFEPTEFQKRLADDEQQLEQARAELEKTQATQKADIAGLEAAIENEEANLRLAELQVERMAFEATVEKERAQIEARKAKLRYQQAVEKLEAQKWSTPPI